MSSRFVTADIWDVLTAAASQVKSPAQVAVAYFGKGAGHLLPLAPGSTLVVDASEAAVKGGLTYPAALLSLHRKGVNIYSAPNLHAKVFAFGNAVYIGSANASSHSAHVLREAMVRVTDVSVVRAVRRFINGLCLEQLGPDELKRLHKLYRPPTFVAVGIKVGKKKAAQLSTLRVAPTREAKIPDELEREFEVGREVANRNKKNGSGFYIEEFFWTNRSPFRKGQLVIEVYRGPHGRTVSPPGHVIHTRKVKSKTLVYVELPNREWKAFSHFPAKAREVLDRGGEKSAAATAALLANWRQR